MSSAGELDKRFFWERIRGDYLIYDRNRGAGCFGENYIGTVRDGVVAEEMCRLMNLAEQFEKPLRGRSMLAEIEGAAV